LIPRALLVAAGLLVAALLAAVWAWNDRPDPRDLDLPRAATRDAPAAGGLTVTWLGVTTLLFDDGETRILTDGFFSRPGPLDVVLDRPVAPDPELLEAALEGAGIRRLAAVIPVHSHYDHAMDSGEVAKRTGAVVLGSASTAFAARGAGLPEERIREVDDRGRFRFGRFTVTLVRSRHIPVTPAGEPPFPGAMDAPLVPPAPVSAWREGGSYSIVVEHPRATTLVQGSAGFVEGALDGVRADTVLLSVGGLSHQDRAYASRVWQEVVARVAAERVVPVHWDDFTQPYGRVRPFPRLLDDARRSVAWLRELAERSDPPVRVELPTFGEPMALGRR